MRDIIIYTFILLGTLSGERLSGQYVKTLLLLDRQSYGTGEIAYGYFTVEGATMQNKSLRFEVVNISNDETVYQASIKVKNNGGSFYIPISEDMKSGTYAIEVYVCTVENVTTRNIIPAANAKINIINGSESKLLRESFYDQVSSSQNSLNPSTSLKISTEFNSTTKSHDISLSNSINDTIRFIAAADIGKFNMSIEEKTWNQTYINSFSEKIFHVVHVSDDKDQKQFGLIGLYSDNADKMFISKSDIDGKAIFLLDDFEGSHGFNLFVYQNYAVKTFSPLKRYKDLFKPVSDNTWNVIQAEAEEIMRRNNIHHYFEVNTFGLKSPSLMKKHAAPKPFWNITPSTYKIFPELQSFCKENSLELRFKSVNDKIVPALSPPPRFTNTYEKVEWEYPLFIIDGKPENDFKKIASMKPQDINSMEIYYEKREIIPWLYAFGSNGVVKMDTKNKPNINPELRINGYQSQYNDHHNIIGDAKANNKPILIPTILWKNNIENTSSTFSLIDNTDNTPKNLMVIYSNNKKLFLTSSELKMNK